MSIVAPGASWAVAFFDGRVEADHGRQIRGLGAIHKSLGIGRGEYTFTLRAHGGGPAEVDCGRKPSPLGRWSCLCQGKKIWPNARPLQAVHERAPRLAGIRPMRRRVRHHDLAIAELLAKNSNNCASAT